MGQIKFFGGPGAEPGARPKSFEILKFDDLTVFKVFGDMNGVGVKYS